MGKADGIGYLLDLLARDASAVEFERPVVEARAAGLPATDIEALDRAKRVALGVREQLAAHRRREAELAALFQTASDLAALTSVDDVLAAIVRRARALLGRDTAYLCLNDDERGDTLLTRPAGKTFRSGIDRHTDYGEQEQKPEPQSQPRHHTQKSSHG